jgi:hypothetical protein
MWSRERLWKDRDIYLSYFDVMNVFNFIREVRPRKFTTKSQVLKHNLKRWANELGIQPGGIGSKSTRKTRFVWLLKAYPEYEDLIIKTMDYNPTKNAMIDMSDDDIDHYKRVQLDDKTIRIIKSLLYGWNTSIE